jgi:hypothetical protein
MMHLIQCAVKQAFRLPAMRVFLPAFPKKRRHGRRRGNLKGRSTDRARRSVGNGSGAFLAPHYTGWPPRRPGATRPVPEIALEQRTAEDARDKIEIDKEWLI